MEHLKTLLIGLVLIAICIPFTRATSVHASTRGKALILSTLQASNPMTYSETIKNYLTLSGYDVTFLNGTTITLNLMTTQLNNYDIVIWRTDAYDYHHTTYWLIGDSANPTTMQTYADDFAAGWLNANNGMLGASIEFFLNHFTDGTLGNVQLGMIISSVSVPLAKVWIQAGAKAVIETYGQLPGYIVTNFYMPDYVTNALISNLAKGATVKSAVLKTVNLLLSDFFADNPIYLPQVWYLGDGTTTITGNPNTTTPAFN